LANFKQRLNALEVHVAETGTTLTDSQIAARWKKAQDDEACSEIETVHPGYLGSQNTFYVGTMKGVGRIYKQTFVDTYSKIACAKLYTTKTQITAADLVKRVAKWTMSAPQGMPCGADTSSAKLGVFISAQERSIQPVPTTVLQIS
jgi:hypothetical protein